MSYSVSPSSAYTLLLSLPCRRLSHIPSHPSQVFPFSPPPPHSPSRISSLALLSLAPPLFFHLSHPFFHLLRLSLLSPLRSSSSIYDPTILLLPLPPSISPPFFPSSPLPLFPSSLSPSPPLLLFPSSPLPLFPSSPLPLFSSSPLPLFPSFPLSLFPSYPLPLFLPPIMKSFCGGRSTVYQRHQ